MERAHPVPGRRLRAGAPLLPQLLVAAWIAACAGGCGRAASYEGLERERRSVVLWVVDTLRADHLSTYGYGRPTSPRLDELARSSVVFERCQAQSTWTKPATSSILTGLHPSEHGVNYPTSSLDEGIPTVAEVFRASGYRTGAFVTNGMLEGGFDRGFEDWTPYYPTPTELGYVRAETVVDDALAWLEEDDGRPYFLYVHLMDPHVPYDPPADWLERFHRGYEGDLDGYCLQTDEDPATLDLEGERLEYLIDLYDAEIAYADHQLGRLLDVLDGSAAEPEPLFVFTSDHGEEFGEHGAWQHNPLMYQGVTRVPLVVRFPLEWGLAGTRSGELAAQIDLLPTLADAVGVAPPAGLPGHSLLAVCFGRAQPERAVFSEVDRAGVVRKSVVSKGAKYIRQWSPGPDELLFDLDADPGESTNVAGGSPVHGEMRDVLRDFVRRQRLGQVLVVRNFGDEMVESTIYVATERPLERFEQLFAEEAAVLDGVDGPFVHGEGVYGERTAHVTRFHARTAPGDRDGVLFRLAPDEEWVAVGVQRAGEGPLEPEALLLGASGKAADSMPLEFAPAEARAHLAPGWSPLELDPAADFDALFWWAVGEEGQAVPLPAGLEDNLEALGYTVGR